MRKDVETLFIIFYVNENINFRNLFVIVVVCGLLCFIIERHVGSNTVSRKLNLRRLLSVLVVGFEQVYEVFHKCSGVTLKRMYGVLLVLLNEFK